jgi:hypothetical protein
VNRPPPILACASIALVLTAAAPAALAQHGPPPPGGKTVSLQGGQEHDVWVNNPYMHSFYDLSRSTLGPGAGKVDVDAYEQKSFAIFRDFGVYMHVGPEHMQDHLKLIPRQVVQIVREDPKVLDSYDNFMEALMGPK